MERDYRPDQGPDDPDRRRFLWWIFIGAGGSFLTCSVAEYLSRLLLGPLIPAESKLRGIAAAATATAVFDNERRTSFTPEGKFTEEIYQQVARSLVVLEIDQIGQLGKGGTGWCVAIPGSDEVVIVTARHLLPRPRRDGSEQPSEVRVYHPMSGTSAATAECLVAHADSDLMAMRLRLNQPLGVSPLSYQVRPLTPGTQVLTAGFSNQFLVEFSWSGGPLTPDQAWEVRAWRMGQDGHPGVVAPTTATSVVVDVTTWLSGNYCWTAGAVTTDPYRRIGVEADPICFEIPGVVPVPDG